MAGNHGFTDGNKRTTLYLLDLLIDRSGYTLESQRAANLNDEIEELILTAARGQLDFDDAVRWFSARLKPKARRQ
jgi:death-on-curing protein